jgi:hypothetical protein
MNIAAASYVSVPEVELVAEITIFGTSSSGFAFHARGRHGARAQGGWTGGAVDGKLGLTEAIWQAVDALAEEGVARGIAAVYAPGGDRVALVDLGGAIPWAADLPWVLA